MKFKPTWSFYSRLASFASGAALVATPFSFKSYIETGSIWFLWQGAIVLSVFWVMLYLSHIWANVRGGKYNG